MKNQIFKKWASVICALIITGSVNAQEASWTGAEGAQGDGVRKLWDMSTDDNGNIYYVGEYQLSGFDFGGATFPGLLCAASDGYIIKTDSEANTIWSKHIAVDGFVSVTITSVSPNSTGDVYVSGYYINFLGLPLVVDDVTIASAGFVTNFMLKLDSDGVAVWSESIGEPTGAVSSIRILNIEIDTNDDIVINGYFNGEMQCGDILLEGHAENLDSFIGKLNSDGTFLWVNGIGANDVDAPAGLAVNDQNEVFCSGSWASDTLWAGEAYVVNENPLVSDNFDRWIAKYTADGALIWLTREGGLDNEFGAQLAADSEGGVMAVSRALNAINVNGVDFENVAALVTKYNFEGGLTSAVAVAEADAMVDPTPLIGEAFPSKILADGNGNYIVSVTYASENLVAGDITIQNTGNAGTTDFAVINIDGDGEVLWALGAGGLDYDYAVSIAMPAAENATYAVGGVYKSFEMEIGNSELQNNGSPNIGFYIAGIDYTTGVLEAQQLESIAMFPNPASEHLNIDLTGKTNEPTVLRVFDMNGRKVDEVNVMGSDMYILNLNEYGTGLYFIEITNTNHRMGGKFITNK